MRGEHSATAVSYCRADFILTLHKKEPHAQHFICRHYGAQAGWATVHSQPKDFVYHKTGCALIKATVEATR